METDTHIVWRMRSGLVTAFIVTIVVTSLVGLTGFFLLRDQPWQPRPDLGNGIMGGGLALLGVGVVGGLWIWVLRAALLGRRYGDAELELEAAPVRLGDRLRGRLRAKASLANDEAVNLVLQCSSSRSSGGDSGGETQLRWDSETLLTANEIEQGNGEITFPFDLAIPADQSPTGEADNRWETSWTLAMRLEPNTGYKPAFDITVNRDDGGGSGTTDARGSSAPVLLKSARVISTDPEATRGDTAHPRPPHARVSVTSLPDGGTEFTPPKKLGSVVFAGWCLITLPLWVILPIWGLADLKGVVSPPLIAYLAQLGLAFGVALVFNGVPLILHFMWNRSVRVGPDGVSGKRPLGRKVYPAGHFSLAQATGNSKDGWMVSLERSTSEFFGGIPVATVTTEDEARWLVASLGLALDDD